MPARWLLEALGLARVLPLGGDFTPGPGPVTISLPGFPPFSPLICYEIIFSGAVRGPERPGFLLNITNDAWFGSGAGPYQHFANTGISAVIDPLGRVVTRIPLASRGVVDSALPAALPNPGAYARFGEPVFALMLTIFLTFSIIVRKK